jgi:hypothetical protein
LGGREGGREGRKEGRKQAERLVRGLRLRTREEEWGKWREGGKEGRTECVDVLPEIGGLAHRGGSDGLLEPPGKEGRTDDRREGGRKRRSW